MLPTTNIEAKSALPFSTNTAAHPQADDMIESGRPWKDLFPLFPNKEAAYQYYGFNMFHRFNSPAPYCAMCGRSCDQPPITFIWRANLHTKKTVLLSFIFSAIAVWMGGLYSRWIIVQFATTHCLCLDCQRRHRNRKALAAVTHKLLFALLILLVCLTVPLVVFLLAFVFIMPEGVKMFGLLSLTGIGLLALVTWGIDGCRRAIIPQSLHRIGRFPFFLFNTIKVKL